MMVQDTIMMDARVHACNTQSHRSDTSVINVLFMALERLGNMLH
jgi:hypothetical protein